MKLKSFITFPFHPPFIFHHFKGTAIAHIPATRNEEIKAIGINFPNDFFGRKTTEIQGKIINSSLTMFGILTATIPSPLPKFFVQQTV